MESPGSSRGHGEPTWEPRGLSSHPVIMRNHSVELQGAEQQRESLPRVTATP